MDETEWNKLNFIPNYNIQATLLASIHINCSSHLATHPTIQVYKVHIIFLRFLLQASRVVNWTGNFCGLGNKKLFFVDDSNFTFSCTFSCTFSFSFAIPLNSQPSTLNSHFIEHTDTNSDRKEKTISFVFPKKSQS